MLTRRYHQGGGTLSYIHIPIIVFFISVFWLFFPACSPKIIEKTRTEYVYQDVHHRDTLVTRDSVYIREWLKGDTVYIEKYKDRYVFRDRRGGQGRETLVLVGESPPAPVSVAPAGHTRTGRLDYEKMVAASAEVTTSPIFAHRALFSLHKDR